MMARRRRSNNFGALPIIGVLTLPKVIALGVAWWAIKNRKKPASKTILPTATKSPTDLKPDDGGASQDDTRYSGEGGPDVPNMYSDAGYDSGYDSGYGDGSGAGYDTGYAPISAGSPITPSSMQVSPVQVSQPSPLAPSSGSSLYTGPAPLLLSPVASAPSAGQQSFLSPVASAPSAAQQSFLSPVATAPSAPRLTSPLATTTAPSLVPAPLATQSITPISVAPRLSPLPMIRTVR